MFCKKRSDYYKIYKNKISIFVTYFKNYIIRLVKNMKRFSTQTIICYLLFLTILVASCGKSNEFTVEGVINGADGQTLYLTHVGLSSVDKIDSVKLNPSGKFSFKKPKTAFPDFYQIQLNGNLINFAIDSTETITIQADAGTFATSYSIEDSENNKAIKNIALAQLDANQVISKLRKQHQDKQLSDEEFTVQIQEAIDNYKEIATKYIYGAPMSTAAYFALFQTFDGLLLFDLYDSNDSKAFAAVATSYDYKYPESERAKHLHNLALQSIKVTRAKRDVDFSNIETKEVSYLEIELPNVKGEKIKLSEISQNKVTLINFTVYQAEWAEELNGYLDNIYQKYSNRGLTIYQVSLDTDEHLWKNIAYTKPWYTVHDPQSVYSKIAAMYNVKQLPCIYIIDKKGNLTKKVETLENLEKDLISLL